MSREPNKADEFVATADGECKVFYNDVAHDPDEDSYLERVGWYYQSVAYDDGPRGPYDSKDDAAEGAKDHYGHPAPALG